MSSMKVNDTKTNFLQINSIKLFATHLCTIIIRLIISLRLSIPTWLLCSGSLRHKRYTYIGRNHACMHDYNIFQVDRIFGYFARSNTRTPKKTIATTQIWPWPMLYNDIKIHFDVHLNGSSVLAYSKGAKKTNFCTHFDATRSMLFKRNLWTKIIMRGHHL